ncbi:DNA repair protein RadA [Smaragdicoccus niigatensis]|uniref:DNA repair protein RadA n=1 Tax=Smaragdicoccus niigatensis TaxID=359359 RepID=UPI000367CDE7|nr:DNA repair protein RadA [Smaragdicoccus niigatensis]
MTNAKRAAKIPYRCAACQHQVPKWLGRCPDCGEWGSIEEVLYAAPLTAFSGAAAAPLTEVDAHIAHSRPTGITELDRVLGGGLVPGAVILLAGEPGVGKSTLLLEVVHKWAVSAPHNVALYVTGEETAGQVRRRADRTNSVHERVYLAADNDLTNVLAQAEVLKPSLLVVDSIQTVTGADVEGVPGGVNQVRSTTLALTGFAKRTGCTVLLVGHVTKEGAIAGPRTLEHLVDVVLNFEGDRYTALRMVRAVKNRFGSTEEVGCFEMSEKGITGISDPSGLFIAHRGGVIADELVSGTAITATLEGNRAMLAEIQALAANPNGPVPRRTVSGLDYNRAAMVLAVLEQRCGIKVGAKEIYAATVGGIKITEPAADLAVAMAISSAVTGTPVPTDLVAIGEVGLTGELRPVVHIEKRLTAAVRLGYKQALVARMPEEIPSGIRVIEAKTLRDALR